MDLNWQMQQLQLSEQSPITDCNVMISQFQQLPQQQQHHLLRLTHIFMQSIMNFAQGCGPATVLLEQQRKLQQLQQSKVSGDGDLVRVFSELPPIIQQKILNFYPNIEQMQMDLMEQIKRTAELISIPNKFSAINAALQAAKFDQAAFLISVCHPEALDHRCPQTRQSLAMRCIASSNGQSAELISNILQSLLQHDATQIHRFYDDKGCNVFHYSAEAKDPQSLQAVCTAAIHYASSQVNDESVRYSFFSGLKDAIEMPMSSHSQGCNTPLHIAAAADHADHIRIFQQLDQHLNLGVNFEVEQLNGSKLTPMQVALAAGATNAQAALDIEYDCDKHVAQLGAKAQHTAHNVTQLGAMAQHTEKPIGVNSFDSGVASFESPPSWSEVTQKLIDLNLIDSFIRNALNCVSVDDKRQMEELAYLSEDPASTLLASLPNILPEELITKCLHDLGIHL